ncbi:MAG: YfcE family phosphodiesterase, partial [Pseudomonadota bacterium]
MADRPGATALAAFDLGALADEETVLIVSDTHGRLRPGVVPMAHEVDRVIHCGDIGRGVLERLAESGRPIDAVIGNNDDIVAMGLPPLPEVLRFTLGDAQVVVVHGHQCASAARRHRWLRQRFPEAALICYGHSHRRVFDQDDVPWILNPGAC